MNGTEIKNKPTVNLVGQDGNIFAVIGVARKALLTAGRNDEAKTMTERTFQAQSYHEALAVVLEYVEVD